MSLIERVVELRQQREIIERAASKEQVELHAALTKDQARARATNLKDFHRFEKGLGLRESLESLAGVEQLENPRIYEWIREPVATLVELRLVWHGKPKMEHQENVAVSPQKGFFSISIGWMVDGSVKVSGEREFGSFSASLLNYDYESYKKSFEESIAKAYLNPRWNEQHYQVVFQNNAQDNASGND